MKNAMKLKLIAALIAVMLLLIFANAKGQGVKISALPTLSAPDSSADYIPIVHSGTTYKVTPGKLFHEFGASGGSGSPGGSNTHIQYNNSGAFGGSANFSWNNSTKDLKIIDGTLTFETSGLISAVDNDLTIDVDGNGVLINGGLDVSSAITSPTFVSSAQIGFHVNPYNTSSGNTGELRFLELAANGSHYTGFKSPDSRSANLIYTLPSSDPTSGQVLIAGSPSGGAVGLLWGTVGGAAGSNGQIQFNNSGAFGATGDFTWDNSAKTFNITGLAGGSAFASFNESSTTLRVKYYSLGTTQRTFLISSNVGSSMAYLGDIDNATGGDVMAMGLASLSTSFRSLAGTGTRMVVASSGGVLSTQAIPSGTGTVTSIATTSPITGGTITTTGTIGIDNAAADGTTKGAASFTAADFNSSSGLISIDYTNGQKAAADGSTLGFATFTAADFNSSTGLISIDYTNGQAATSGQKGFLTSADWSTFNGKQAAGSYLTADGAVTGAGSQAQVFTSGIETGLIDDNGTGEILVLLGGIDKLGVYTSGVQTVAGSAASPSYSFFTDPTSGLYLKTVESEIGASVDGALVGGFNTAGLFANSISELSAANGVLIDGVQLKDGLIAGQYGGTGVANTGKTITLGGNLTTSGANNVTLTTSGATNVTLPTSGTLVNSAETTLSSLASIGTVTTGSWTASVIAGQYGGTGVANTGKTITLGGNLTTSGAHATTFTTTGTTGVTLPTTGTLATLDGTETFTNKSIVGTQLTGTAYTFAANNTNGTAAYGFEAYERHAKQTYSGTITFNSTVPTSLTSAEYSWSRIGDVVTLTIAAIYASPGATNTTASFTLPSDCPSPVVLAGSGDAANEYTGFTGTGRCEANVTANPTAVRVGMKRNSANTGWEIHTTFGSTSAAHIAFTIVYSVN